MRSPKLSRRGFICTSLATSAGVLNLSACANEEDSPATWNDGRVASADEVVFGLYPSAVIPTGEAAVRAACRSLDWSWLGAGDSVLVKISSNSGNEHPASTSPAAVRAMVAELFERGAGRVIVGEQSGVEHVRLVEGEQRVSSTAELLTDNGLLAAIEESGAESHFFDDQGYADGYFEATLPADHHWSQPMWLPRIVREVDHIVYLPRLSSHVIAGYTHAHKLAVGWLRDDSRNHLHLDAASFYEKFTEINYTDEIRDRLRLVLSLAEKVMLDFGPDTGTVHVADPRIVIASQNIRNHDLLATSLLVHLDRTVEAAPGLVYDPLQVNGYNRLFVTSFVETLSGLPWGPGLADDYTDLEPHQFERGVSNDKPLQRAWELVGKVPERVDVLVVAEPPAAELAKDIQSHTEGLAALV